MTMADVVVKMHLRRDVRESFKLIVVNFQKSSRKATVN